eukprot:gene10448-21801_t
MTYFKDKHVPLVAALVTGIFLIRRAYLQKSLDDLNYESDEGLNYESDEGLNYESVEGSNYFLLTNNQIDYKAAIELARSPKSGAVSSFLGTTRDFFEGRRVTELRYEAYNEMALEQMKLICENLRTQWSLDKIVIQHKLGSCPIGEISVVIVISSEHRKDSLEAVHAAIDELKANVPIWKKEFYDDAKPNWKKNIEFAYK